MQARRSAAARASRGRAYATAPFPTAAAASAGDLTDAAAAPPLPRTRSLSEVRAPARSARAEPPPGAPPWDPHRPGPHAPANPGRAPPRDRRASESPRGAVDAAHREAWGALRAGTREWDRAKAHRREAGEQDTRTSVEVERGGWSPAHEGALTDLPQARPRPGTSAL